MCLVTGESVFIHFRLHFTPMEEYDSTNALFNGALLDELPSEDLNDTTDPIIDIIPDHNDIPQGLSSPAVTTTSLAPSAENMLLDPSLCEPLLAVTDTVTSTKNNNITSHHHHQVTDKTDSISATSSSPQTTIIDIEKEFDTHQKRLHALKVG